MRATDKTNPLLVFEKIWRAAERIVVFSAFMVVTGTVGYISVHMLA